MSRPALMTVTGRLPDDSKVSDELFNRFYNKEHLPDILASGWTKLALRYKRLLEYEASEPPYLAVYPLDDISDTSSPAFVKLVHDTTASKVIECDNIFEHIDFKLHPYEKIQSYDARGEHSEGEQHRRYLVHIEVETNESEEADFDSFFQDFHNEYLDAQELFHRCTLYKKVNGECPTFLVLYEFAGFVEKDLVDMVTRAWNTDKGNKIRDGAKRYQVKLYSQIQAQGDTTRKL